MSAEHGLADALRALKAMAQEAAGNVKFAQINAGGAGLPREIMVALRDGAAPQMISVKPLLEEWRVAPERRRGVAKVDTLHAFIDLTRRHQDAHSVLFAQTDWPAPSLTAVIDYHQTDGTARFGQHRVHYAFPLTREFSAWVERDGKPFGQAEFAAFVEENIMDLSLPLDGERAQYEALFHAVFAAPTDLIALARGLEIHVDAKVKNVYRIASGEAEVRFESEHKSASGEPLHVPGLFMLSCRAFVDGAEVRLPARLRYRVKDGALVWFYQLYKWQDALRARVGADLALAAAQTGLPAYEGAPEAAS